MIQSMRGLNLNCLMVLEPQILKNKSIVGAVLKYLIGTVSSCKFNDNRHKTDGSI